jgi:hypothetical protein
MQLSDKIIALYPQITKADFSNGNIVLQNDGNGTYIKSWNYQNLAEPTQAQLDAITDFDIAVYQQNKIDEINSHANDALLNLIRSYPELEINTWPQQYSESLAFNSNNSSPTPMLSAISKVCSQSVEELAQGVLEKAELYQKESGEIIGKRILLADQVYASSTSSEIQSIKW